MKYTAKIIPYGTPQKKVYLYYSHRGEVLRLPTDVVWRGNGVYDPSKYTKEEKDFIDDKFNVLESVITEYKKNSEERDYPPILHVKERFRLKSTKMEDVESMFETFMREDRRPKLKPQTLEYWDYTFKKYLFEFAKKYKVDFSVIDTNFINNYYDYLSKLGNSDNWNLEQIKKMRYFIRYFVGVGLIKNCKVNLEGRDGVKDWKRDKFRRKKHEFETVSNEELKFLVDKMYNFCDEPGSRGRYKKHRGIEKALDVFVFSCYTSLRYSDIIRVNRDVIKGDCIYMDTQKTGSPVQIDLNDITKYILEKRNYNLKLWKDRSGYTDTLKVMLKKYSEEMPSLGRVVTRYEYRNGVEVPITKKRYEWFGTHSGRRSFVTINYEKGIPLNILIDYTGHQGLNVISGYIQRRSSKVNVAALMEN